MERDFKRLDLALINTMIIAHSNNSKNVLTPSESAICHSIIFQLEAEIALRKAKETILRKLGRV